MKILIIRFSSAGDIIIAARAIKALKKTYKNPEILFATKASYSSLVDIMPVKKSFLFEFMGNTIKDIGALLNAAKEINSEKIDCVVDLQNNIRSRILSFLVKAKKKVVYKKDTIKRRFSVLLKWFLKPRKSVFDNYIDALEKAAGIINKTEKKGNMAKGKSVLIHVGAKWILKRWPYFVELINKLKKEKKYKITITGMQDEVENSREMLYIKGSNIKNLIGKTGFKDVIQLIKESSLFIGNDTAIAHLARHYNIPAIVFLGPTVQSFGFITGSDFEVIEKDLNCRPCHLHGGNSCPTGEFECMKSLPAKNAVTIAKQILAK